MNHTSWGRGGGAFNAKPWASGHGVTDGSQVSDSFVVGGKVFICSGKSKQSPTNPQLSEHTHTPTHTLVQFHTNKPISLRTTTQLYNSKSTHIKARTYAMHIFIHTIHRQYKSAHTQNFTISKSTMHTNTHTTRRTHTYTHTGIISYKQTHIS